MKQTKRKSFVVYTSWRDCFELLDEAEKAQMLMNLFDYHEGNEPTLNTKSLQIAWSVIKPLLKLNTDKYANQVERAMINVEKRKADVGTTSLRPRVANVDVDVDVDANADGDVIDDAEANVVANEGVNENAKADANDNSFLEAGASKPFVSMYAQFK
jgi:hypothetical protein